MNIRPARQGNVEPDITPLIDVVFLLLIFFMVSTSFDQDTSLSIVLPEATEERLSVPPNSIQVTLEAGGGIHVRGKPLPDGQFATIRDALLDAATGMSEPTVIINGDAAASHQSVIRVMDAARNAGLMKITFAAIRPRADD